MPGLLLAGTRVSGQSDLKRFGELEYLLGGAWVGGRDIVLDYQDNIAGIRETPYGVEDRLASMTDPHVQETERGCLRKAPGEYSLTYRRGGSIISSRHTTKREHGQVSH
jgi:hypothetical protein